MKITFSANTFQAFSRVEPPGSELFLCNVKLQRGAQILNVPPGSAISNLSLGGGASYNSRWAVLRGAVLKFKPDRTEPAIIDGKRSHIPSGHTLMDHGAYVFTRIKRNQGKDIPYKLITHISPEKLFLIHASYCHPDELFLLQGTFTKTSYTKDNFSGPKHGDFENGILFLREALLPVEQRPFDLLSELNIKPQEIKVQLEEGGQITLTNHLPNPG